MVWLEPQDAFEAKNPFIVVVRCPVKQFPGRYIVFIIGQHPAQNSPSLFEIVGVERFRCCADGVDASAARSKHSN